MKRTPMPPRTRQLRTVSTKKAARDRKRRTLLAHVATCGAGLDIARAGFDSRCNGRHQHDHHIRRQGQGGADILANLLPVCGPCHKWIHDHPAAAHDLGLLAFRTDPNWDELGGAL